MAETRTLLEEPSPGGAVAAVVEEDERCAYLYLQGAPGSAFTARSCWLRNHRAAPAKLEVERMKEGEAPMLPAASCLWPNGSPHLDPAKLSLVWFEEGTGAALYEGGELLALIPPAGDLAAPGFSRDCQAASPLALPLGRASEHPLAARLEKAKAFWKRWAEADPWPGVERGLLEAYRTGFGAKESRSDTEAADWPPRFVARFALPGAVVLATGGMSIRPQPYAEGAAPRRVELAVAVDASLAKDLDRLAHFLAAQTDLPWQGCAYLAPGHTVGCGQSVPRGPSGTAFEHLLLCADPPGAPAVSLPAAEGEPVRLLWLVPITTAERAAEKDRARLLANLWAGGATFVHRDRPPATRCT
ncbi:MAG: suppressor of fused domain protein [Myxococcaceae bacterium]